MYFFSPLKTVLSRCSVGVKMMVFLLCSMFGSVNLTTVRLTGVGTSFQKHGDAESKGIKAHFNMDESGVLMLDRVSSKSSPANPLPS